MKAILASLILFPGLAFASTGIRCNTFGSMGKVVLTITAEDTLLGWPVRTKVVAVGRRTTVFETLSSVKDLNTPGQVTVALYEVNPQTGTVLSEGTQGELSVLYETVAPGINVVGENGVLKINQIGETGLITLRENYVLTECKGVL